MEKGRARALKAAWILGSIATVALLVLAWNIEKLTPKPTAPAGPLHLATFPDGGKLEILGSSVGTHVIELAEGSPIPIPLLIKRSTTGYKFGSLRIDTQEENGRAIRHRIRREDTQQVMMIDFRLIDSRGDLTGFPRQLSRQGTISNDLRLAPSLSTDFLETGDGSVAALNAEMARTGLNFLLQHRDPDTGWIHLKGPVMVDTTAPDHCIAFLDSWDRSLPTLAFRAIREDGEVVEFSLPNPDHRPKPKPIAPAALPFVHRGADYTLTIRGIDRFAVPSSHPFAVPDVELTYTGPPVSGLPGGPIVLANAPQGATDEWGNTSNYAPGFSHMRYMWGPASHLRGAILPASSRKLELTIPIIRGDSYPRKADEGYVILVGEVSADGDYVEFSPLTDAILLGVTSVSVGRIRHQGFPLNRSGGKGIVAEFSGGGRNMEPIESRIGDIEDWRAAVFPSGSDISAGIADSFTTRKATKKGNRIEFTCRIRWLLPPDLLEPGDTFRIGVFGKLPTETVDVDLELPAEIQKP